MAKGAILIVDDNPTVLESLQLLVADIGYDADVAASGFEALKKLENSSFDLVLTDSLMPGMNGVELASAVKQCWPTLPVVLVSGNAATPSSPDVALLLQKPFALEDLRIALARLLPE